MGDLLYEFADEFIVAELVLGSEVGLDRVTRRDSVVAVLVAQFVGLHHLDDVIDSGVRPEGHRDFELGALRFDTLHIVSRGKLAGERASRTGLLLVLLLLDAGAVDALNALELVLKEVVGGQHSISLARSITVIVPWRFIMWLSVAASR